MLDGGSGSRGFEGAVSLLRGVECFEGTSVALEDELDADDDMSCGRGPVSCLDFSIEVEPWANRVLLPGMLKKDFNF